MNGKTFFDRKEVEQKEKSFDFVESLGMLIAKGDEKMKTLTVISRVSVILISAMILPFSAYTKDIQTPTNYSTVEQYQSAISGQLLASLELKQDYQYEDDMGIFDILIFIDESVEKGALEGKGPNNSSDARLRTLVKKIELAEETLSNGSSFEEVCQQLSDAYMLTDGMNHTPDLVYGQAAPKLAEKIKIMRTDIIGCDEVAID